MAVKVVINGQINTAELQKRGATILADILKRKLNKKDLEELKIALKDRNNRITM